MSSNGSSPSSSSTALRTVRQGSISQRQRLLSISALSVEEEIRQAEGGGVAVPMEPSTSFGGPVGRIKGEDFEALPLHLRRRGSLPRSQPDPSLRPPPSPNSMARALSSSPVRGLDLYGPPSPSSASTTLSLGYSLGRPRAPNSPLSTPTSEYPPDVVQVERRATSPDPFVPPSHKPPAVPSNTFPLPIPSPSLPLPQLPSSHTAFEDQAAGSRPPLPTLHVRTASGSDVGPPPPEPLPQVPRPLPRGPSSFRGLVMRPPPSGTPSPTREVFWGGQGGSVRRGSGAVTPGGSTVADDGAQMATTSSGSTRYFKPMHAPVSTFNLNEGKMLNLRARVATPKDERPAFIEIPRSCPPFTSPLPSPLLSPSVRAGSSPHQHTTDSTQSSAAPSACMSEPSNDLLRSPADGPPQSSSFSVKSASSELSTSSSATASTSVLDTPMNNDAFAPHPAAPKSHPTASQSTALVTVESASLIPVMPLITETGGSDSETGDVPPLPDVLRSRKSSGSSAGKGGDRSDRRRKASGHGALKLDLTDDEAVCKMQSKTSALQPGEANGYESDDLLSSYPSSGHRTSDTSLSRKSSTPSLVADLRKGSTASYRSFNSTTSEPFAYDDGWSGSDDSDHESIPLPKPRMSFSRSSIIPPVPVFVPRPSARDIISSFPTPPTETPPPVLESLPNRSSSLPITLSSPNSSLRSTVSVGTTRPLSQPESRDSLLGRPRSTASGYFPSRPSSIFSLSGDGCLVSDQGRILPRPKQDSAGTWGDVEIAYEGANLSRTASKNSQVSGVSRAGPSSGREWEEAAERLPERKTLLARRESGTSSHASSDKGAASQSSAPPSAMRKLPASVTATSQYLPASQLSPLPQLSRSIPIRKATNSGQMLLPAASATAGTPSPSHLPSPSVKKSHSGHVQQRSLISSARLSLLSSSRQDIELPTIEPLRITRMAAPSPATKNKALPVAPAATSSGIPVPRPSGLPTRTPVKSQTTATPPPPTTGAPTPSKPTASSPAIESSAGPALEGPTMDPIQSPKPSFGPAAGRRMSKRPSVSSPSRPQQQQQFYSAPPLPPLPMLPPALAFQRP